MIIYCIEDINDLKYVGKTTQKLHDRWRRHLSDKYNPKARKCSSNKLNLYNSIIIPLEECDEENAREREQYWKNKIDCVNVNNPIKKSGQEYSEKWRKNNREKKLQQQARYRENNRDKLNAKERERYKLRKAVIKIK